MVALERGDDACMRCTFLRWGKKKEEELLLNGTWYQRGWLKFFFMIFDFLFNILFWFLVFYCRVTRVARGVFSFFFWWALGWVGLGFIIQHGGKFCPRLDYRYMLPSY